MSSCGHFATTEEERSTNLRAVSPACTPQRHSEQWESQWMMPHKIIHVPECPRIQSPLSASRNPSLLLPAPNGASLPRTTNCTVWQFGRGPCCQVPRQAFARALASTFHHSASSGMRSTAFAQFAQFAHGPLAQWIRRRPPEPEIPGSSPGRITI